MFFVLGGMNLQEIEAVHSLSREFKRDVMIGSTHINIPKDFINNLASIGEKRLKYFQPQSLFAEIEKERVNILDMIKKRAIETSKQENERLQRVGTVVRERTKFVKTLHKSKNEFSENLERLEAAGFEEQNSSFSIDADIFERIGISRFDHSTSIQESNTRNNTTIPDENSTIDNTGQGSVPDDILRQTDNISPELVQESKLWFPNAQNRYSREDLATLTAELHLYVVNDASAQSELELYPKLPIPVTTESFSGNKASKKFAANFRAHAKLLRLPAAEIISETNSSISASELMASPSVVNRGPPPRRFVPEGVSKIDGGQPIATLSEGFQGRPTQFQHLVPSSGGSAPSVKSSFN
jgi:hypothetical protein